MKVLARPSKQTAEYFPHYTTSNSRTIYILQETYGNDGYAFWFKLLEILASTNGHYFDAKDLTDLEFLSARAKLSVERTLEILDKLSSLKAIDSKLWNEHKVIWCQNFVDNLDYLYSKRKVSAPTKPIFSTNEEFPERKPYENGVSDVGNPQSKVKESKGKDSKEDESIENTQLASKLSTHYENCFRTTVIPIHVDKLQSFVGDGMELELVLGIMEYSASKKEPWTYCITVLNNNFSAKILTLKDFEANLRSRQGPAQKNATQKGQLVSKNPTFTNTYSHNWDLDELDAMAQEYLERQIYGDNNEN